jgi:protein-glutamine gamma-glutamyltransferase
VIDEQTSERADAIELALQLHVCTLAVLAGLLVDIDRDGVPLSPFLASAAILSFLITDYMRWFRMPLAVVGVVTLGAIVPLSFRFLENDTAGQLNAISYLLTIWLSVMFFQVKSPRVYRSLIVLTLLLVVVAAILNSGILFAVILLCYEFVGLSALILVYIHSGRLLLHSRFLAGRQLVPRIAQPHRNPYALLLGHAPIAFQEPSSLPDRGKLWDRGLIRHILGMGLATLIFGAGFFYSVPRTGQGEWTTNRRSAKTLVGFSSEMTFEEMGRILQSNELAFRVSFTDARTKLSYPLFGEPYIQGKALSFYDVDGRGQASWRPFERTTGRALPTVDLNHIGEIVRQEFLLEPTGDTTIFAAPAAYRDEGVLQSVKFDRHSGRIFRPDVGDPEGGRQFRYSLYTTGFRGGSQMPLIPVIRQYNARTTYYEYRLSNDEKQQMLQIDRERFPYLISLANKLVDDSNVAGNRLFMARILQNHFHDTTLYRYTLDFEQVQARRNAELDPIEDFVANHRTGHCEYFASSLALMLRSLGIPARVVIGYLGGEYNRVGGYYLVHQRDAHAWVEAYLEPHEVPEGLLSQAIPPGGAAWYRLDPTPPSVTESASEDTGMNTIDQMLDYAQLLWNDYVLDMNPQRQRGTGLAGLENGGVLANIPLAGPLLAWINEWWQGPSEFLAAWRRAGWWNWRGGVVAAAVTASAYFCFAAVQWLRRRAAVLALRVTKIRQRPASTAVAFYLRLEALLAKLGHERGSGQTQREFVDQALGQPHEPAVAAALADGPQQLVEYFYRVRFGQQALNPQEERDVQQWLEQVARAVHDGAAMPASRAD